MKACPRRSDFYATLASGQADIEGQLESWLKSLEKQVDILNQFYKKQGIEK